MKKSNFVSLLLGVVGTLFLGIGMCMCLLPEWELFQQGIIVGVIGLLILLITVLVYRKMEHKSPIKINGKFIFAILIGIFGALSLGVGMCLTMIYEQFVFGIIIGIIGIVILLCLIPFCKGLK